MSNSLVDKVAEAVLYEGYILYPYRASSRKNRERFTFGRVYPLDYSTAQNGAEPCMMQTQCLVRNVGAHPVFSGRVRFLHAMAREICASSGSSDPAGFAVVPELRVDGKVFQTWHEAVERAVAIPEISLAAKSRRIVQFEFPASRTVEEIRDSGRLAGLIRRAQRALAGDIEIAVEPIDSTLARLTVRVSNDTPLDDAALADPNSLLLATFSSTHTILEARDAEFLSLTDPSPDAAAAASQCENIGTWPVLVGDEAKRDHDTILSSPIILYDYPQIAAESPGALCDSTEIDEILTLRVMTMTDDEKRQMRDVDSFAHRILERTESLRGDDLMRMHGVMRDVTSPSANFFEENTRLDHATLSGVTLRAGARVRICPKGRADAMDMILAGKIGLVEAIEQDAEGRIHLALVLDDDPGRDLGMLRQPGHRFFYTLDEVEPLAEGE